MKNNDEKDPLEEKHADEPPKEKEQDREDKIPESDRKGETPDVTGEEEKTGDQLPAPEAKTVDSQSPAPEEPPPSDQSPPPEDKPADEPPPAQAEAPKGRKAKPSDNKAESTGKETRSGKSRSLVEDHEEQQNNASWDELDDEQTHPGPGDGQQDQDEDDQAELVNYNLLSKEDLVKLMREKLDNPARGNMRREVEEIKDAFQGKQEAELEEKKKHFLEQGGNLEDFKPADDPADAEMKELLGKYREMKAEFSKQLEKTKSSNLDRKQAILEEFRVLMEGQESFEVTFRKFKDLQRQWFATGVVPQQNLKDLWDSYNYFVDKFNDYVRINRDLRALDLKKNLELKVQLCEKTEELEKETNVVVAFKTLQKYHARWREIGPVPRENRDELWDRFKKATSVINRRHQEYHSRLKESLYENLKKKTALCEEVESLAATKYDTHKMWVDQTNKVLEIQKTWKTIGYAPKKENNSIYARFRRACDVFFSNKAEFYAAAYEEQKDNMRLKAEIVEKAESLKDSQDWKATTSEMIRLQKQWKEVGPVPRRESDKLWKKFRAACDAFFDNKSRYFEDIDSTFDDNLKAKEDLIGEMEAYQSAGNRKKDLEALGQFQKRFEDIGFVPSSRKDWIKEQFRNAQDRLLERIGMDEFDQSLFRFRNRIGGMLHAPRGKMKLSFERDKLMNKLQQLQNEIGVWENNIGYFTQSDPSDDTLKGMHEKIDAARERIRLLEAKIQILDDMENEN